MAVMFFIALGLLGVSFFVWGISHISWLAALGPVMWLYGWIGWMALAGIGLMAWSFVKNPLYIGITILLSGYFLFLGGLIP